MNRTDPNAGSTGEATLTTVKGSHDASGDGAEFLCERLVLLCKLFAAIDVVYYALFSLALSLDGKAGYFETAAQAFSLEALGEYVLFAVVWLVCRFFGQSLRVLRVMDAVLLLGLGCLWSSWCFMHPFPALGAYEMVLALVAVPVLRAVLVPSTGIRTFLLTAAACVPGLVASNVASRIGDHAMMSPATLTVLVLNWCSLSVIFSTVASSVVYGLRSEVRRAQRLGQYTLTEKIGEGGMGTVYLAQHAFLRRRTVVKVVGRDASPHALDRFEREAQLTSQLTHPNTIAVYDFGRTEDGAFYYAMEHLEGMDLEDIVHATGPLHPARVIHILRQACGALEEAHATGLLHRDIKPSNLYLCPKRGVSDAVKVLDFGLVKDLREDDVNLTQDGALLGTPLYMSPELITGPHDIDARSDIYALGAVAYFLLVGEPLFSGATPIQICSQHLFATPVPPSRKSGMHVPGDLESIVLRCLEKDPDARYADIESVREALDTCHDADRWTARDADGWWSAHADLLAPGRASGVRTRGTPPTLVIDVGSRRGMLAGAAAP
jgi:hypothetical protein